MVASGDEFCSAVEIIPGRLFFACVKRPECVSSSQVASGHLMFEIDNELVYEPFFADFGPLNMGKTYRFCQKVTAMLAEADRAKRKVFYFCGPHAHAKANASVLIGIYQVMYLKKSAEDAYKVLMPFKPFSPFRDASCGPSSFHLTVFDCLKGMQKARDVGFLDWGSPHSTWSGEEYDFYEQVENGDLSWIMPGKFVAFSGPAARGNEIPGYRLHTPEDYWDYYKKRNVTAIVRLNKKLYDRKRFTSAGFRHYELYFPDGTCPSDPIIQKFIEMAEAEPGALAVHCKAGLGRTGVLILCFLMKHYRFTTEEAIGYIRICRPGSVIGPQQNFMREVEQRMWQEGDMYRQKHGLPKGHLGHIPATELLVSSGAVAGGAASPKGGVASYGTSRLDRESASGVGSSGDLSLTQYRMTNGVTGAPSTPSSRGGGPSLASSISGLYGAGGGPSRSSRSGSSPFAPRLSVTPARLQSSGQSYNVIASASPPTTPTASSKVSVQRSGQSATSRSLPCMPPRAPSADRAAERIQASSLRSTIHTDTLHNADRPRGSFERNAQSALGSPIGSTWSLAAYGVKPGSSSQRSPSSPGQKSANTVAVARTLAPNGQPRKVPVTMLSQYHARMGMEASRSMPNSPSTGSLNVGTTSAPESPSSSRLGAAKHASQLRSRQ